MSANRVEVPTIGGAIPQLLPTHREQLRSTVVATLAEIARHPMGQNLGGSYRLEPIAGGFATRYRGGSWSYAGPDAKVLIPERARGAARVEWASEPSHWLTVEAVDLEERAPILTGDALVHEDALPSTTVLHTGFAHGLEELRVVRAPSDEHVATYRLRFAPGGRVVVDAARNVVELIEGADTPVFVTAPVVAFDHAKNPLPVSLLVTPVRDGEATLVVRVAMRDAVLPVTIDPAWSTPGSLPRVRYNYGGVTIGADAYFFGGNGPSGASSAVDRFVTSTNSPSAAGSLPSADYWTAFAVSSTAAIVVPANGIATTLYNTAGTTSSAGNQVGGLKYPGVQAVGGTTVMWVGGSEISGVNSKHTNIWNGSGWVAGPDMACAHPASAFGGAAAGFATGDVLVGASGTCAPEYYRKSTNSFTTVPFTGTSVNGVVAALKDGRALAVGGSLSAIFSPSTMSWEYVYGPSISTTSGGYHAATLASGRVLVVGGWDPGETAVFDPASKVFQRADSAPGRHDPFGASLVALADGRAVLAGGDAGVIAVFNPLPNGSPCAYWPGSCASFACVDGYCCSTACTGGCQACDVTPGTCTTVTSGKVHVSHSCHPYATCTATGCATTCATTGDCAPGTYCSGTTCVVRKTNGTVCTKSEECSSNQCVDGVCCNTACTDKCAACDVATKVGTCSPVAGSPHGSRAPCAGAGTTCGSTCDGVATTTCTFAASSVVCAATECKAGVETHANTCNGVGACKDTPKTCSPYGCGATTCKTSCTSRTDCAATFVCSAGACIPGIVDGKPVTDGTLCVSGFAADGVCCDTACTDACVACTATKKGSGTDGVCGNVAADTDPRDKCDPGSSCGPDGMCDGLGKCRAFAKDGTSCGTTTCSSGTKTGFICNGKGICNNSSASCFPYACSGDTCGTTCKASTDCGKDAFCSDAGTCAPKKTQGDPCGGAKECASGLCVDGVCCLSACTGQCEACNEKGAEGTCIPVKGTPRGTRTACKGEGTECGGQCNGTAKDNCEFQPTTLACGDKCKGDKRAACDGAGGCGAPTSCPDGLTCADASECKKNCATEADCVSGYSCAAGRCVPRPSKCSDDRSTSIDLSGKVTPCDPVLCDQASGICAEVCKATSDCVAGKQCDSSGKCVDPTSSEQGSCAFGNSPSRGGVGLFLAVALLGRARRKRRSLKPRLAADNGSSRG